MKQNDSNATRVKRSIDVELALRWAWRDELVKRATSAAESIWDRIEDLGRHGGIDVDDNHVSSQRYAHIGEPDPDALVLEQAVARLEPVVIDWSASLPAIAGPLAGLVSVNDFKRHQPRTPKAGWGPAGDRALRGWFGPGGERPQRDRPRDIMMIGTFHPKTLVTVHAAGASRPPWDDEDPKPVRVLSTNGKNAKVEGRCEGRDRYSAGSHCPLDWLPSPTSVILARADYVVWWEALNTIAETVELEKFALLPPRAPALPWFSEVEDVGEVNLVLPLYFGTEISTLNNLLGCQFRARMRVVDFWLPKTAKLGFWLQGKEKSGNLYYNYRNRRQTISQQLGWANLNMEDRAKVEGVKDSGWRDIVIDFDGSDGTWQCMGSRPERDQVIRPGMTEIDSSIVYGCAPNFANWLADAASEKIDIGIFVFFENTPNPSVPPTAIDYVDGKIQLDSVSLWKPG